MAHLSGTEAPIDGRLRLLGVLLALVFFVFVFRLFQLQIRQGEDLRKRSEHNSVRTIRTAAPRGEIVDRNGAVLATTRPAYELEVVPADLRRRQLTLEVLGRLMGESPEDFQEKIGHPRGAARFQPVLLADDLDWQQLAKVEVHDYALPGVNTVVEPRRHYPNGKLAAHVLGTIGQIQAEQLQSGHYEGYESGDVIGQTGVEQVFEHQLHGRDGGRNVLVDALGREVQVLDEVPPEPGGRVVLALDAGLQRAAETAFEDVKPGQPPRRGAAVVMDVRNGDVLALVSRPAYDPNDFAGGIDAATWNSLLHNPWHPLQDRAIQNAFPPGSTFKAIMAAALLQEKVITPQTHTFCPGYFRYGRRIYRCWRRGGHGSVDVIDALERSCDVFFYTHGVELGIERLARYARAFGLGERTGIALPGEVPGLVPSPEWKEKRFGRPWYPGETVSASIGQGYNLYTPIQMAVAYAAIANGGKVLRPRLALRVESRDGTAETSFAPVVRKRVPVSPQVLAIVRKGLTAAVEGPHGTGRVVQIKGVLVAGKTGTAQVVGLKRTEDLPPDEVPIRERDHAWFLAFAPADDPQIVVSVFVEHGMHGASGAGPIVHDILEYYFRKQDAAAAQTAAAASGGRKRGLD